MQVIYHKLGKTVVIIKLIANHELSLKSGLQVLRALLLPLILSGVTVIAHAQTIGLHVAENHNVLFGNSLSGAGTKLMWLPNKQSLLAGSVNGLQWDQDSIYENNIIFGIDNQSSTEFVTINGKNNAVSGIYSAVFGLDNKVIEGKWSLLNGRDNLVESDASYAIINGKENRASYEAEYAILNGRNNKIGIEADYTTVNGLNNIANTSYETVLGRYADTTVVSNYTGAWDGDHQLFAIGNGTSPSDRNNALTVLKNGNIEVSGKISNLSDPVADQDAATKKYVDNIFESGSFTPTWATVNGFSGTVPTCNCDYTRVGDIVTVVCSLGVPNFGSGQNTATITLPTGLNVDGVTKISGVFSSDHFRNSGNHDTGIVCHNNSTTVRLQVNNSSEGVASAWCNFVYKTSTP